MARLEPGTQIDRYTVIKALGTGAMAEVYLVDHAVLGSRHALKVLKSTLVRNLEVRQRFLNEGRIMAQIRHPNIVDVTDIVAEPGVAGLVMEYVEGPTLEHFLTRRSGPPSVPGILELFIPLLEGVDAVHRHQVVHRDLKPSNVIVSMDGRGDLRPVILDFGIAHLQADGIKNAQVRQTRVGARIGTPQYMSPEQVEGRADLDHRADIFSLGAILYEIAVGRVAFGGESAFDTMDRIVQGHFEPILPIAGDDNHAIAAAIRRALKVAPNERFADCDAFIRALKLARVPTPVVARHPESAPTTDTTPAERPAPPPVGQTVAPERPDVDVPAPIVVHEDAPVETRRRRPALLLLGGAAVLGAGLFAANEARERAGSRDLSARAIGLIETQKTDPARNADIDLLREAANTAHQARALHDSPEARGAEALAVVLEGGWHYAGASWDEVAFSQADALTGAALLEPSPEAHLARAILVSNGCALAPAATAAPLCEEAETAYQAAEATLRNDPRAWLRFEMWWTQAVHSNRVAMARRDAGDGAGSTKALTRTLVICDQGYDDLEASPVNDLELAQECLSSSGALEDWTRWLQWSRWLQAETTPKGGSLPASTVVAIARSVPDCEAVRVDSGNPWSQPMPHARTSAQRICEVATLYALGCPDIARGLVEGYRAQRNGDNSDYDALESAWDSGAVCALER